MIISNGFNRFHLAVAAEEMYRRGKLVRLITGAYPSPMVERVLVALEPLGGAKVGRLLRRGQRLPTAVVTPLFAAETLNELAMYLRQIAPAVSWAWLNVLGLRLYGWRAVRAVMSNRTRANVYHYRAGFGGDSARVARALGMVLLCDHSIAHPALVEYLVEHGGAFPPHPVEASAPLWRHVQADIELADHVIVNSDFVRDTFIRKNWDPARVHVAYLGVDDRFLAAATAAREAAAPEAAAGPFELLFAGSFERRKGAEVLIAALENLGDVDWRLSIAGSIDPAIRAGARQFFRGGRVAELGTLPHDALARAMVATEAFVFPSLAEGSARVIFEALAAGCYVITTPNSGSIVQDYVHGRVVPAGDAKHLADAVRMASQRRSELRRIGRTNAELVRARFRQSNYGDALDRLYAELLGKQKCEDAPRARETTAAGAIPDSRE